MFSMFVSMSHLCDLFFIFSLIFIIINHITTLKQTQEEKSSLPKRAPDNVFINAYIFSM